MDGQNRTRHSSAGIAIPRLVDGKAGDGEGGTAGVEVLLESSPKAKR
jgi:hypothetical protein